MADLVELAARAHLRREDLYEQCCFLSATHLRPEYVLAHEAIADWLPQMARLKAERPAFHTPFGSVPDPGRMVWQGVRRWIVDGSAADFTVVDRLLITLEAPMTPWSFPREAFIRRRNFPWDERAYAGRIAITHALMISEAIAAARMGEEPTPHPPALPNDEGHEPLLVLVPAPEGARCPGCGCPVRHLDPGGVGSGATQRRGSGRNRRRRGRPRGPVRAGARHSDQLRIFS